MKEGRKVGRRKLKIDKPWFVCKTNQIKQSEQRERKKRDQTSGIVYVCIFWWSVCLYDLLQQDSCASLKQLEEEEKLKALSFLIRTKIIILTNNSYLQQKLLQEKSSKRKATLNCEVKLGRQSNFSWKNTRQKERASSKLSEISQKLQEMDDDSSKEHHNHSLNSLTHSLIHSS